MAAMDTTSSAYSPSTTYSKIELKTKNMLADLRVILFIWTGFQILDNGFV